MTTPGILDVIALPDDISTLPDPAPFYHAVSKDQSFLVKKTMFGKALVPVKTIDHLKAGETGRIWWAQPMPKIPADVISQVWSFFRHIHKTKGSESMVYLTYKDGEWRPFIPPQEASYTHVRADFKIANVTPGWLIACSIHSHCDFGGFHSGTDERDAREHEGLHMTIGEVDKTEPDIAAMVSISGTLFTVKPDDIIEGALDPLATHPAFWNHFVHGEVRRPETPKSWGWYDGKTGLEVIESGKRGGTGEYHYERWQSDDDYLDWALKRNSNRANQQTRTRYYMERSFFDLIELSIRNGDFKGDENEAFAWAVDMDARLDDLLQEASEYGIDPDVILRRVRGAEYIGNGWEPFSDETGEEEQLDRLLLGDGDDINDILEARYN